jgi:hypothetical protein
MEGWHKWLLKKRIGVIEYFDSFSNCAYCRCPGKQQINIPIGILACSGSPNQLTRAVCLSAAFILILFILAGSSG